MHSVIWLMAVVTCLLLVDMAPASAAGLSSDPILQLDTGMHNAPVSDIAIDKANRYLVSGARDKQVRIWSLPEGKMMKTLRLPIDKGTQGEVNAVAISPDGETILCGGRTYTEANRNYHVYLFDRSSGGMLGKLEGFPSRIQSLQYSPDGKTIAVGLFSGGVRIFNAATLALRGQTNSIAAAVYAMDYDKAGRLAVATADAAIHVFDAALNPLALGKTRSGQPAQSISFSPDAQLIAVGSGESLSVEIFSAHGLQFLYSPDVSGIQGRSLSSVAWSSDGRRLLAGGRANQETPEKVRIYPVYIWDDKGRGARTFVRTAKNSIRDIVPLSTGGFAYASADPIIGAFTERGERIFLREDRSTEFRETKIHVSHDGSSVGFMGGNASSLFYRFSLADGEFGARAGRDAELVAPVLAAPGIKLTAWKNSKEPKLNGQKLPVDEKEEARTYAIAPDRKSFVMSGDWYMYQFDAHGKILWKKRTSTIAWALNISPNGKVVVAGHSDGTARWYRMSDGREIAAMHRIPPSDSRKGLWVAWTPQGYYAASAGGEELLGWQVNNGWDREAYFYSVARFRNSYYRPDLMASVVKSGDGLPAKPSSEPAFTGKLPPVVRISSPVDGSHVAADNVPLRFTIESPSGETITSVKVLVDGRPVSQTRDIVIDQSTAGGGSSGGKNMSSRKMDVPLQGTGSTITVIALTKSGESEPVFVKVFRKAGASGQSPSSDGYVIKPKLYILSVGVSKYTRHPENNLVFAAKDARDFAGAMMLQKGKLYRDVTAKVLTDAHATRESIVDGLQWLKRSATQHDVAMIFMSSHGDNSSGQYYFIPSDFDKSRLESSSVLFTYIKDAVASIPGKVLVFMDTCHAGDVLGKRGAKAIAPDINGIVNELTSAENGAVVFTSSTGRQQSLENEKWNNGAFTRALVDGLSGKADLTGRGRITINMLDVYLSERVKELTDGKQTPTTAKPQTIQDFPIALVR